MSESNALSQASVQDIQLELIRRTSFNALDGERVHASLLRHRHLWLAALLDRPGVPNYAEPRVLLTSGLIKLRDLPTNFWNADTQRSASTKEAPQQRKERAMRNLGSIFTKQVVTVRPEDTLARAAELMERENVGAVVVADHRRPLGILTDRDVAIAVAARGSLPKRPVQEVMTCPVTTMRDGDGVFTATQYMMENALRRVPVVDDEGLLVGLVSLDDLLVLLSRELDNLARSVEAETASAR